MKKATFEELKETEALLDWIIGDPLPARGSSSYADARRLKQLARMLKRVMGVRHKQQHYHGTSSPGRDAMCLKMSDLESALVFRKSD